MSAAGVDIATLGLEVRSDGVVVASDRLRQLQQESGKAEGSANSLSKSFDGMAGYIKAAAAAFASWKLAEYAKEAATFAARVETLGAVMTVVGNNAGYTGKQMEGFAAGVAKMGITTESSRQTMIRMGQANLDMTKASTLARIAQDAAVIAQTNSSDALDRMMNGLATGQSIIMHHMGLMTDFEGAYVRAAAALGKTSNDLTESEKSQARMNETVRAAAGINGVYEASMSTAGKQLSSMKRYTDEIKLALGDVALPAFTLMVWNLVDALKATNKWLQDNKATTSEWGIFLKNEYSAVVNWIDRISTAWNLAGIAAARAWQFMNAPGLLTGAVTGNHASLDQILNAQAYILEASEKVRENGREINAITAARAVPGPALDPSEKGRLAALKSVDPVEAARIAAGKKTREDREAEEKRKAAEKAAEAARQLAERQAQYDRSLTEATFSLKEQRIKESLAVEALALKERLSLLKQQLELGTVTEKEALDQRYQLERDGAMKELDLLNKKAAAAYDVYSKTSDDPAQDRVAQLKDELKWQEAVAAAKEKARSIDTMDKEKPGQDALLLLKQKKELLSAEAQLLSMTGNGVAAVEKQIEIDKLGRVSMDAKTKAILEQTDVLKLLTAQQKQAAELAAVVNKNAVDEAQLKADQAKLSGYSGSGAIDAQLEADKTAIKVKYDTERQAIQDRITLLQQGADSELNMNNTVHAARMAQIEAENKAKYFDNPEMLKKAYDAQEAAEKTYATKINKIRESSSTQNAALVTALQRSLLTSFQREKQEELTAEDKAARSKLSMYANYAGGASELLSSLASTQNQTSRQGFETAKAFNMAAAVMSTAAGIMNQYSSGDPYSANFRAAIVAATGAIQIATIASTSFGGGAAAAVQPPGAFGDSGGRAGAGGAMTPPPTSVHSSQTEESLRAIVGSLDNASLAIGKVSNGLVKVADLFTAGSFFTMAAGAANGQSTIIQERISRLTLAAWKNTAGSAVSNYGQAWTELFRGNISEFFDKVGDFLHDGFGGDFMWGGDWRTTGAGLNMSLKNGKGYVNDYLREDKQGGLFEGDSWRLNYKLDSEMTSVVQAAIKQASSTIGRASVAMGTSSHIGDANLADVQIATAGRKDEDIVKDMEAWLTRVSDEMAKTVDGLKQFTFYGENAFDALVRLSTALQSTNEQLKFVGAHLIESTLKGADAAYKLQQLMGGAEKFSNKLDGYFTSMFSDTEQAAAKYAQAQREVRVAFNEMHAVLPSTREEFRRMVNTLDVTTDSGAKLFAALMDIAPAFGFLMEESDKAATKIKETAAAYNSMLSDTLVENLNKAADASRTIADQFKVALNNVLTLQTSALNTLSTIKSGVLSTGSPESIYKGLQAQYAAASDARKVELAQQFLTASRQFNASGSGYQFDYGMVTSDLARIGDLPTIANQSLGVIEEQLAKLKAIKDALDKAESAQSPKLGSIVESNATTASLLKDYLAANKTALDNANKAAAMQEAKTGVETAQSRYDTAYEAGLAEAKAKADSIQGTSANDMNRMVVKTLPNPYGVDQTDVMKKLRQELGLDPAGYVPTAQRIYDATMASFTTAQRANLDAAKAAAHAAGVPGYANGGFHPGGLRIVGERGPELEATGPSRIWTADQTRQLFSKSGDNDAVVAELKQTNAELKQTNAILIDQVKELSALVRVGQAGPKAIVEAVVQVADNRAEINKARLAAAQ